MKAINNFPDYSITRGGKVYSKASNTYLKPYISAGYMKVKLYKKGESFQLYVHRLVALTYITTNNKKKQVNHKNFNKKDNRLSNLEWMTRKQNVKHYWESK